MSTHLGSKNGPVRPSKRPLVYWLLATLAGGCASVKSGEYAKPIQTNGQMATAPMTPAGLLISGTEVESLSSPYFGLVEITFENPTGEWIHIDAAKVTFAVPPEEAVISTAPEIAAWERAIRQRSTIRRVNINTPLALLAIAGAAGSVLSPNRSIALAAGGVSVSAGAALVGKEVAEVSRDAEGVARLPETHLMGGPFAVPPGLFVKKWLLVYTRRDVARRCVDRMTLSYQPAPARWEHVVLSFKVRSSEWQPQACLAEPNTSALR
jgi:hypothetical protein